MIPLRYVTAGGIRETGGDAMLRPVASLCIWLLLWPCFSAQTRGTPKPTLQQQLILLDAGSAVEVQLKNREKIRGRLGAVRDTGFDIQYVVKDQTVSRTLSYDEVKKAKQYSRRMSTAAKITLGVLAGLGVLLVVSLVVVAASGGFDS